MALILICMLQINQQNKTQNLLRIFLALQRQHVFLDQLRLKLDPKPQHPFLYELRPSPHWPLCMLLINIKNDIKGRMISPTNGDIRVIQKSPDATAAFVGIPRDRPKQAPTARAIRVRGSIVRATSRNIRLAKPLAAFAAAPAALRPICHTSSGT